MKTPAKGALAAPRLEAEQEGDQEKSSFSVRDLYHDSPAWLTSLVIHMIVVIILGLITIAPSREKVIELIAALSTNEFGNTELRDDGLDIPTIAPPDLDKPPINIIDGPPVDDPSSTPLKAELMNGLIPADPKLEMSADNIANFLKGRDSGSKQNLAIRFGATNGVIDSVALALEWIARQQQKNGSWSLTKPYSKGAPYENVNAATAMAMLALQGDGNTHLKGKYQKNVAGGLQILLRSQAANGALHQGATSEHQMMYTHAFATIVLCELYGMTNDSRLREPCERAVKYLVTVQSSEGGWRYRPGYESDTSVTGWCVMALQSARAAKLDVPNDCLKNVSRFLDSVSAEDYGYSYLPKDPPTYSMTAEALLCRQLLGMKRKDPSLAAGIGALLRSDDLTWEKGDGTHSVYGWYYASQVIHHYGGKEWEKFNSKMRVVLPENQIKNGPERGSWPPDNDFYGSQAGRLYETCLCTYMLEIYWRHLPIYREVYEGKPAIEKKELDEPPSDKPKDAAEKEMDDSKEELEMIGGLK